ncbi:S1/P1 nuclease, partial [Sphingomonas sp. FUKUSWIS1]
MIRKPLTALGILAATALTAAPASAYWEYGHETVAQIAYANVAPRTKVAIRRILAQQALLDTPECPAGTIEEASVWADCIKPLKTADGKSRFGFAYSWHYQNVDVCAPFDLTPACKDGDCVSAQIDRDVTLLRDRKTSPHDRVQALAFLIHFVGDLHQPLHAGDRHDKGGNDVKTDYGIYAPARLNLHSVWDGTLAERAISAPPSLVRRYPAAERARIAAGTVA